MNRLWSLESERPVRAIPRADEPLLVTPLGTGVMPVMPADPRDDDIAELVHDLKGPIATIGLEIGLLADTLGFASHPLAMSRITRNLEFLDRLVQDLLDGYSIDTGILDIRRQPTQLRALLERVVDRVVSTRDRDRVVLEAGAGATVAVDAPRIERVVANLIGNAIKYAPPASQIIIRLDVGAHTVQISVTDSGPGMSATEAAYVFDKHRRTPSAQPYEGTGIGLHVSKKIVEAHGGRIGVDSVRGFGSRFYFDLQLA